LQPLAHLLLLLPTKEIHVAQYQVFSQMPRSQNSTRLKVRTEPKEMRLAPTVLLLSYDEALAKVVQGIVKPPWKLVRHGTDKYVSREVFALPNVRLVIFDDQAVEENDRGWMLAQIRKHFSGISLLYVAAGQSDANEKRARTNGAHYYVSKPLSVERFGHVLESFLHAQQFDGRDAQAAAAKPGINAEDASAADETRIDAGIRRLSEELNREDSQLRSGLLDAALAGLRLERNPESRELRRDAARIWAAIEPVLSHHLNAEDSQVLPWLVQQGHLSPEAVRKVRDCHDRLRTLIGAIVKTGANGLSEEQVRNAGRALTGLAVNLDDAIDDETRRLFPTIQKALYGVGSNA
jgi:DNA-binding response OmpR family regulator